MQMKIMNKRRWNEKMRMKQVDKKQTDSSRGKGTEN